MKRDEHEADEGGDIFRQQKETKKAIRLDDDKEEDGHHRRHHHHHSMRVTLISTTTISCLMIILIKSIYEPASSCLYFSKNNFIKSTSLSKNRNKLTISRPSVKMLHVTFIIVLALMATCYPLAVVVCAEQHQHQLPAQQVFLATQNSHYDAMPSQLDITQGNPIEVLKQQEQILPPAPVGPQTAGDRAGRRRQRRQVRAHEVPELGQPMGQAGSNGVRPLSSVPVARSGGGGNRQASSSLGGGKTSGGDDADNELQVAGAGGQTGNLGVANYGANSQVSRLPNSIIRNVTAQNGQSVLLHCIVEPSSELVVSWFRGTGEPQLLTYESNTVIDDQRFVVRHGLVKEDDWALQIKNLDKATDSGLYQCQTNSEPPQSQFYQLNVIEPQVNISGAPDMAVKLGSAINLTCIISQSPDQLQFIFWYKNDRMINYDMNERGKIVISKWPQKHGTITSNLQIFHSKLSDSGNYTCSPSGARPMSIYVHVLEGLDKRLTMFQNDNYEPSAASSQQTNSALSVHVVRLSKGRVYALFVAYVIFASWFHLVTQAQTCISFLLLAIIGFFLGKVTGNGNDYQFKDVGIGKSARAKHDDDDDDNGNDDGRGDSQPNDNSNASTIDPLIRRANSALNLLKSLGSESSGSRSSGSSCDGQEQDLDNTIENEHDTTLQELGRAPLNGAGGPISPQKAPLNSPSGASTSSSFASTGYNSDSRSTNLVLVRRQVETDPGADKCPKQKLSLNERRRRFIRAIDDDQEEEGEEACEMIELVTEPTAMSLLMEEFESKQQRQFRDLTSASSSVSSPSPPVTLSGSSLTTPIKPPRLVGEVQLLAPKQQRQQQRPNHRKQLDSTESHYSSPTNSLAYPNSASATTKHSITEHSTRSPSIT